MFTHVPGTNLLLLIIFTLVSIFTCIFQIVNRKKINLLSLCKVSIFIPLTSIIIWGLSNLSSGFWVSSVANDIAPPIWNKAISRLLASSSLALLITILLGILYAITETILSNQKK